MALQQNLGRHGRPEITIVLPDQLDRILPDAGTKLVVRGSSSSPVNQGTLTIAVQQPLHLPDAYIQNGGSRLRRPPPSQHLGQDLDALQVLLAHRHPAQSSPPKTWS